MSKHFKTEYLFSADIWGFWTIWAMNTQIQRRSLQHRIQFRIKITESISKFSKKQSGFNHVTLKRVILKSGASLAGRHGPCLFEVRVNSTNLGKGWWTEFQRTCHKQFSFWLETVTNTYLGRRKEDGAVCVEIMEVTVTVNCPTVYISTSARQRAGRTQPLHSPIAYVPKRCLTHILWLWRCPKHWLTHYVRLWHFSFALLIRSLSLKIAFY